MESRWRGVAVDHSTIYRWVQRYAPEMEKRLRWQWRCPRSSSRRVDQTYVKVRGKWAYPYRALDKFGNTIDFYLRRSGKSLIVTRRLAAHDRLADPPGALEREGGREEEGAPERGGKGPRPGSWLSQPSDHPRARGKGRSSPA